MVIADVSISTAGAIRWTGAEPVTPGAATNRHTILEFIQFLMDLQDDEQAAGNDLLDITVDTPFNRSTDQILTLNFPFNIDDTFASHLYDGSVRQTDDTNNVGNTLYSGINIIGPVESGTEYMILQDGKVLTAFWATGINPEAAPSLVFSRHLVKSRERGADIDGKRITVLARTFGGGYRRFAVALGTGNSVAAIGNGADIFNAKSDATIAAFTDIVNTEGFQQLNIDGAGVAEGDNEYYSQWTDGSRTTNDVYERTKWISQNAHVADATAGAPTGTDFIIDNGTIVGQSQSFLALTDTTPFEFLTEIRANIHIEAGAPTGPIHCELRASDDATTQLAEPTGALLARSEDVLSSSISVDGTYQEVIFRFNRINPSTGAVNNLVMDQSSNDEFFAVFQHLNGGAGDHFSLDGAATDVDSSMNQAVENPSSTWTASATSDLDITVKTSPSIHGIAGEYFQGINIEVGYDGVGGTGVVEDDIVHWGTDIDYDNLAGGPFQEGEFVKIVENASPGDGVTSRNGGKISFDDGSVNMIVALETVPGGLVDNDIITGLTSGATALVNAAPAEQTQGGGQGIVLAEDDNTTDGEVYLQVLDGVDPVENNIIYAFSQVTNFVTATAVLNTRTIVPEFVGTSTGSNIIGAYGIGYVPAEVGASDLFLDLSNTSRTPPNNVTLTVSGLVSGQDRVLVGPRTGSALDRGQWLVSTLLNSVTETAVVVKTGTDTVPFVTSPTQINWPATGIGADNSRLRIERDNGIYERIPYDSHNGTTTFTLGTPTTGASETIAAAIGPDTLTRSSGDFLAEGFEVSSRFSLTGMTTPGNNIDYTVLSLTATVMTVSPTPDTAEAGSGNEQCVGIGWDFLSAGQGEAAINNDVFLGFVDVLANATSEAFTGVHQPGFDRLLFVRVRDGGATPIKTFEATTVTFTASSQTIAAVRTSDA